LNRFTLILHGKGWLVKDFIEYWGICRATYERMTANAKSHDKLNKMIAGLPDKESEE